jgi:hypothetical protein
MSSNEGLAERVTGTRHRVAVLVPCDNDKRAIPSVVADFPAVLPEATAYVYDNNSTDGPGEAVWRGG